MIFRGDNNLPVRLAGQAEVQRPHSVQEYRNAHPEERREHHVGEDADVGAVPLEAVLEREREDDEQDAPARDERPEETDRVPVQSAAPRRFFLFHDHPPQGKGFSGKSTGTRAL